MRIIFLLLLALFCLSVFGKPTEQNVRFTDSSTDTVRADSLPQGRYDDYRMFGRSAFHDDSKPHFTLFVGGMFGGYGPSLGDHGTAYEFGILNLIGVAYYTSHNNQRISLGIGVMKKGINCGDGCYLLRHDDDAATIDGHPEGNTAFSSKINMSSLVIPLFYRQRLYKRLNFYGGPIMRCNIRCTAKSKYQLAGEQMNEKWNVSNLRRLNIDLMAGIDCFWFGLYVKYSPMSDIKDCPHFKNTITLGGTIAF